MKRKQADQPNIVNNQPPKDYLDELDGWVTADKNTPISRACDKLQSFVNNCVEDSDFRQSPGLLDLLIVVRDVLADQARQDWTLKDYLEPVNRETARAASNKRLQNIEQKRAAVIGKWLAATRRHGEKQRFADEMAAEFGMKSSSQIYKEWLSKKSIEAFKKNS